MRNIFLSIALMFFCGGIVTAQNNIRKTAGVNYTSGPPTFTPSLITGSEYAIDTTSGWFYQFHRTTSVWLRVGQGIDKVSVFGPPTYAPVRNISWFAINLGDSLYHYSGTGITWNCINCPTGSGGAIANNGVSDNEDGGKIRLGNRYMASPDAPFTMARKINVDGRLLHIGDYSDSTLFVVDGATDRIGIRTDAPAKDLHVNGEVRISDLINGTPDRVVGANSSGDISRLYLSGMSVVSGVLTATDSSITNEIQQIDTFTIVSNILRASLSNDGVPFKSVDLSPYAGNGTVTSFSSGDLSPLFTTGVATATTTPALSFTLTNQTANRVFSGPASGGAAAPTFRALALADILGLNTANNGLSDNEAGGGIFRLGNTFMNGSDGLFGADRKVNVNAKMLFIGDNTDSTLFIVDGTNDRVGIGWSPSFKLDISGSSGVYTRINTTGAVAVSGLILNNSADTDDSWAVIRNAGGEFQIGSSTLQWPNGTLTTPFQMMPNPPDNSFYMDAAGLIAFGGNTPGRQFDNYGETRLRDLTTTSPALLVGADANGVLSEVTLGSGLSYSGSTLNVSAGSNYQTFRDDNVDKTQRAAANFVSSVRIATTLTDDAANGETEVSHDLVLNSVADAYLSVRGAASVIGRSAATGGNAADIVSTADGQVLRRSGTTLGWGTVATLGITNSAVTYAKIQNAAANNIFLGNNNGAGTAYEELTAANARTILEMTPTINRFALWTSATALSSDAAFTFNGTTDRVTFTGSTAGGGAGTGILNLTTGSIVATTTFLRASGNIENNLISELINSNNTVATSNAIYTIASGGASGGDPIIQFVIAGAVTHSMGVDNSDSDKFKITPNSATPGGVSNASLVATTAATPLWGINKDAPAYVFDIGGQSRAVQYMFTNVEPTAGAAGNGLGTGGAINDITGADNAFSVRFTTGATGLTAGGPICTITYSTSWPSFAIPAMSQSNDNSANEFSKFTFGSLGGASFDLKVRTGQTLTPSTEYILHFVCGGQG